MYISIRYKLAALFIVFFVLSTAIITSGAFLFISGMVKRNAVGSNTSLVSYICDAINFLLNEVKDTSMFFLTNETLISLLEMSDSRTADSMKERDKVYRSLINRMVSGNSFVDSIEILGNNGINISWNKYYADVSSSESQIRLAKNLVGSGDWTPDGQLGYFVNVDGRLSFLRILRSSENLSRSLGYLLIHLQISRLDEIYKNRLLYEESVLYIIDANSLIITSNTEHPENSFFDTAVSGGFDPAGGNIEIKSSKEKSVLFYRKLSASDWYVVNIVPNRLLLKEFSTVAMYLFIVVASCYAFSIILLIVYLKRILSPLSEASLAMKEIEKENYTIRIINYKNDEIGNMARSFNHMAQKLNDLIKQVYAFEIKQRDMQITILRNQMNPHFLYNMLDVIVWKSRAEQASATAEFTRELSIYLRKSIVKSRTLITIQEEVGLLASYINLQKNRLGDSVEFCMEIAGDANDCLTIESVLQPLVENSINHGILEGSGVGSVMIRINRDDEKLIIEVEDDGSSEIDIGELKELMAMDSKYGRGFAIRNINSRIQLLYGREWGLNFSRSTDGLTQARVVQPVRSATGEEKSTGKV
jgi:two-component system sensor histidine kinase YesM